MAFLHSVIGDNTIENREHLEKLGYTDILNGVDYRPSYILTIGDSFSNIAPDYIEMYGKETNAIDCRNNQDLFQAVTAMRDDNHIHQWHIIDYDVYLDMPKDYWFIATDLSGGKHVGCQIDPMYCHKATLSELQAHFKRV